MNQKQNVVLTGMPAVGKSTVGVLLAKRLGYAFVDTDILIQAGERRNLQEIINSEGLRHFQALEERYLLDLSCRRHVIATGGSVIYSEAAMAHLASTGVIVFLDLDLESLRQRLEDIQSRGVVMESGQTLDSLYDKRRPLYLRRADIGVDCFGLTPGQTVNRVLKCLPSPNPF